MMTAGVLFIPKRLYYYRTTTGRNSGLPNSAQWRHDGSGTTAAASAEESWAAARAPTIIPGHSRQNALTHTKSPTSSTSSLHFLPKNDDQNHSLVVNF